MSSRQEICLVCILRGLLGHSQALRLRLDTLSSASDVAAGTRGQIPRFSSSWSEAWKGAVNRCYNQTS